MPVHTLVCISEAVRFTPQGDLLVADVRKGGLRLVRARVPEPASGGPAEAKGGAGAEVKAEASTERKAEARTEAKAVPAFALPAAAGAPEVRGAESQAADEGPALRPVDKSDRLAIAAATLAFAESRDFDRAFAQWARPLGGAGADPDAAGLSPVLNPFSLGHGGLKQVVRWMLRNADEANHPADMADWLKAGKPARPRFGFGLYRHARHAGVVLELHEVQERAARIDDDAGGARVAGELELAGGVSGVRPDKDGKLRYYKGLTLALGADLASLVSIHPGGAPGLAPPDPDREAIEAAGDH